MPQVEVVFFREAAGSAPAFEEMKNLLRSGRRRAFAKCTVRIERLAEEGFQLRRPEAAYLRDGIHELRVRDRRVHYRILYFFYGGGVAVLSHLITKEGRVPDIEIERAVARKALFEADPDRHALRT